LVLEHTEVTVELPDPESEDCRAVSSVLARVGDKWSVLIIVLLGDGPKRFSEIKRTVGGISQRMLTLTLRGLEPDDSAARGLRVDRARAVFVGSRQAARRVGAGSCAAHHQGTGRVR
jgi:HxlR-like helix-turn-helix